MSLQLLQAGPLSAFFDAELGALRHVRWGAHEMLLGIQAPVRNRDWLTVPPKLFGLKITQEPGRFHLRFEALCETQTIAYRWEGQIEGRAEGYLGFSIDGQALGAFESNRIGFCLLHPAHQAGAPFEVLEENGKYRTQVFPIGIAPWQVTTGMVGLQVAPPEGPSFILRFEGEVFEMEDQRNWGDASFKSYCRPLSRPYPFAVASGECLHQRVRLQVLDREPLPPAVPALTGPVRLACHRKSPPLPLPKLGTCWGEPEDSPLSDWELEALRPLALSHLRVECTLDEAPSLASAACGLQAARNLGLPVELALRLSSFGPGEETRLRTLFDLAPGLRLDRVLLLQTGVRSLQAPALASALRAFLRRSDFFASSLFGGTDYEFVELNRRPAPLEGLDGLVFSANPQVHAFDLLSLAETLPIFALQASEAQRLAEGRRVCLSPLTLSRRRNPDAAEGHVSASPPLKAPDPRTRDGFAGAWLLGLLRQLAGSAVESCSFFNLRGKGGLIERGESNPCAIWRVLAVCAGQNTCIPLVSSDPLRLQALGFPDGPSLKLIVGNLQAERLELVLEPCLKTSRGLQLYPDDSKDLIPLDNTGLHWSLPPHSLSQFHCPLP